MKTRKDKVDRIRLAVEKKYRGVFTAVEAGQDGEVVLWAGAGYPVYSVREALSLAKELDPLAPTR
jgi:hypothetical protein